MARCFFLVFIKKMTHLSDFSFLRKHQIKKKACVITMYSERAVGLSYVLLWFLYRIQTTSGFSCLYFSRFKRGELKAIVTALILIMLPFQLYYGK